MGFIESPENSFMIFTVLHFTIGRTASVVFAIIYHLPLPLYLPLALVYDIVQIPLYGFLLENSSRLPFLRRVETRLKQASHARQQRKLIRRVTSWGDVGIVLLCALPIKGFGVLSATVLCYVLGKTPRKGTLLLMIGSMLGILLTLGITKGVITIW
jgi:uncharacterized membrane protein